MINVTKPFTPPLSDLTKYLEKIHDRAWLTNNGPLVRELTERLEDYLGVKNLLLTANGTLALQVAYKALDVNQQAITSPFTFIATASAMKWQGIEPLFADIDSKTLCLCPTEVEKSITEKTEAVVPVHVYGNACDVRKFEELSIRNNLPIIYDASHTFGVQYEGESILNWGDASTLSFHATKLFHTVEGGGIVFKDRDTYERAERMLNFGLGGPQDDINSLGINAKMSEVHAAYGLCVLDSMEQIFESRERILIAYREGLSGVVTYPEWSESTSNNYAYAPILLDSEAQCIQVLNELKEVGVIARRYFYPSLNTVSEFKDTGQSVCRKAEHAAKRAVCLPIYPSLSQEDVQKIIGAVKLGCER